MGTGDQRVHRADRLTAAINDVLPPLADVVVHLRSPGAIDRDELAGELEGIAAVLLKARNATDDSPYACGGPAYLNAKCRCGHARRFHSPHVDPAEPCTHGEEVGRPCDCTQFRPVADG